MAKYRILPDFEKCAHIVFEQKLLFTAVAVNSSRICFDRTGHLMEGRVGSQLKLPLTASSRSGPDKLIQKSLGLFMLLQNLYLERQNCNFNLWRAFTLQILQGPGSHFSLSTGSHGKWVSAGGVARNSIGWIDPSNRAISSSHFKVSSSGDKLQLAAQVERRSQYYILPNW